VLLVIATAIATAVISCCSLFWRSFFAVAFIEAFTALSTYFVASGLQAAAKIT
jgi:hypothetical protein